ncbi:MAG: NAD/NADP octopine/nopaline dehydrogenase family protein [Candidatus Thorarchaeota archaeon]
MRFCIIGAGSGGRAFAAYLSSKGFPVSLYNRSYSRISAIKREGGIKAKGALEGFFPLDVVTQNLKLAIKNADVIMIVTPASAHKNIAQKLAPILSNNQIIILNPGRTFGAVEVKKIIDKKKGYNLIKVGETQTLLFTSRELDENGVNIITIKETVLFSTFPEEYTFLVYELLKEVFPQFLPVNNYLEVTLNNIGMLLHPTITLLNAGMMDIGKGFKFYKEGATPRVCEVLENIELELNAIFLKLGLKQLKYHNWVKESYGVDSTKIYESIQNVEAYKNVNAPDKLITRYLTEDVPTGLVPIVSLAEFLNVATPTINAIIHLTSILCGQNFKKTGRTLQSLNLYDFFVNYLKDLRNSEWESKGYYEIKHIFSHPADFKVCSNCGSINSKDNEICWVCHLTSFRELRLVDKLRINEKNPEMLMRT